MSSEAQNSLNLNHTYSLSQLSRLLKDRNSLSKKFEALVANEEKLKRQRSKEAIRGYPWIEVTKDAAGRASCDQSIQPKGDSRVKNGKRTLNKICEGKDEASTAINGYCHNQMVSHCDTFAHQYHRLCDLINVSFLQGERIFFCYYRFFNEGGAKAGEWRLVKDKKCAKDWKLESLF